MNATENSSTAKIVVGVALAAVFGTGVYVYGLRASPDSQVAAIPAPIAAPPPSAAAPDATTPAPAPATAAVTPSPADSTSNATTAAAAPPAPVVQAPSVAQNDTTVTSSATSNEAAAPSKPKIERHVTKRASADATSTRQDFAATDRPSVTATTAERKDLSASAANSNVTPAPDSRADLGSPVTPQESAGNQTGAPPVTAAATAANSTDAATSAGTSAQPATSDSKISADVKSEIATTAPATNVNVTTTDGVVALAGSVPSEDAVTQAKAAAQRVEGVKSVDTSGLLVSNQ